MAKLERKAFLEKWKGVVGAEQEIDFLEDMADSFPESNGGDNNGGEPPKPDYESDDNPYKIKYSDMRQKYVDRFMGGDGNKPDSDAGDGSDNQERGKVIQLPNGYEIDTDIFNVAE